MTFWSWFGLFAIIFFIASVSGRFARAVTVCLLAVIALYLAVPLLSAIAQAVR